jgi:hypothetical protein
MNDFERKLSQVPFRPPPEALRATVLAAAAGAAEPASRNVRWTWRDWFWPAPQAWAALAALWIIFAAVSVGGTSVPAPAAPKRARVEKSDPTLLSYHRFTDLNDVLQLANN